jgi:5-methylcytosine-specific restriction endonuclease McrA
MTVKRDWGPANEKVESERHLCRICKRRGLDPAHIIRRSLRPRAADIMHPDNIVCLCRRCHDQVDAHEKDLWPHLTASEREMAESLAGGYFAARKAVSGRRIAADSILLTC